MLTTSTTRTLGRRRFGINLLDFSLSSPHSLHFPSNSFPPISLPSPLPTSTSVYCYDMVIIMTHIHQVWVVEAIPAGCEICISYIRTFCRFVSEFKLCQTFHHTLVLYESVNSFALKQRNFCVHNIKDDLHASGINFCSRSYRQQLLQEKFGFSCSCIKCRSDRQSHFFLMQIFSFT